MTGEHRPDSPLCRYCWRHIFIEGLGRHSGQWILVMKEYDHTECCDARGDGAVLSTLPHVPCEVQAVTIERLIELAAREISVPGSFRDTDMAHDAALVWLITAAAGLSREDEDYVFAAIMRAAYDTRGRDFQKAAYRYRALDPWDQYWQARKRQLALDRDLPPVITRQESDARMTAWVAAGRLGHEFTRPGETLCRICGSRIDGIQHNEERWPRDGQPR
jgi:hypothetical protein